MDPERDRPSIRVLSFVEGTSVTGPIKPLLMFARNATDRAVAHSVSADLSLAVTVRNPAPGTADNLLIQAAHAADVPIVPIAESGAWDTRLLRRYADLIRQLRPQIVETHQVKCHFILALALRLRMLDRDFGWIAYHHGYTRASPKLSAYEALDCWSLRQPDRIVTFCKPFARELEDRGAKADRITVIPNAIARPLASPAWQVDAVRRELGASKQDVVVLSVGRLSPEKGHAYLVRALALTTRSKSSGTTIRLVLLGDGPLLPALKAEARDLGIDALFLGHRADVWPYYHAADIFCLPSLTEGSPLALIEAMNAGTPIVATAVGGVPEILENEQDALLCPPKDAAALATLIARLTEDRDLRRTLAANALARAEKLTPETYADRLLTLYGGLLRQRASK